MIGRLSHRNSIGQPIPYPRVSDDHSWTAHNGILSAYNDYLEGVWNFNEGVTGERINGHALVNVGPVAQNPSGKYSIGAGIQSGKYFYINTPATALRGAQKTWNGWYYPTDNAPNSAPPANFRPLVEGRTSADGSVFTFMEENNSGTLRLRADLKQSGGSWVQAFYTVTLTPGQWHMLTFVADGSNIRIYHNGSQGGYNSYDGTIYDSTNGKLWIATYDTRSQMNGILDELYAWSVGLSAPAIAALYNSGVGSFWRV